MHTVINPLRWACLGLSIGGARTTCCPGSSVDAREGLFCDWSLRIAISCPPIGLSDTNLLGQGMRLLFVSCLRVAVSTYSGHSAVVLIAVCGSGGLGRSFLLLHGHAHSVVMCRAVGEICAEEHVLLRSHACMI